MIVLLVLASITIITLDYRGGGHSAISALKRAAHDTFSPVQSGIDAVFRPIGSFLAGAVHYGSVEQQNAKIRQELGNAQRQIDAARANQQTLNTLAQLDQLPWAKTIPTVTAEVIALNPSDFDNTVQLDVGNSRGVQDGMPVVGGAGLIGKVIESWSSGCTVELINDAKSQVGIRFATSFGLLQGQGTDKPLTVIDVAPGTSGLYRGEILTTSGLQTAAFPPNVPVAKVKSFSSSPSSIQETIIATPLADLASLQYVDVLQWEPPQ